MLCLTLKYSVTCNYISYPFIPGAGFGVIASLILARNFIYIFIDVLKKEILCQSFSEFPIMPKSTELEVKPY